MTRIRLVNPFWCLVVAGCVTAPVRMPGASTKEAPLPVPNVQAGTIEASAILGDLPAQASRLGAGGPAVAASTEASENTWSGAFVDVPKGTCVLAYARGGASIEDLDVLVYSDEGSVLGSDEARDAHPTVVVCPSPAVRVYVAAHTVAGEGFVALAVQLVSVARSGALARGLGARGLVQSQSPSDGDGPTTEAILRQHRLDLGGSWEDLRREAVTLDARAPTIVALPLETGVCVDAVVIPSEVGGAIDIEALDGLARVVARAHDALGARSLTVCSSFGSQGTMLLRPHIGAGRAIVLLSRSRPQHLDALRLRPEVAWVGSHQALGEARAERDTTLMRRGYPPARTTTGLLPLGRRVKVPLAMAFIEGACARVDVVAGEPLAWVDGHMWNDGGLVSSETASGSLVLFSCAPGAVTLELEARGRPGPFAVMVRTERWRDPAFASLPLAASRLLQRAAQGGEGIPEGGKVSVRRVSLESTRVVEWGEVVAPASCRRVLVAVEGEGTGVDLQAVDTDDGTVLDRAESAEAASLQVCARENLERHVRIEVRASAGRLDALVSETSKGE